MMSRLVLEFAVTIKLVLQGPSVPALVLCVFRCLNTWSNFSGYESKHKTPTTLNKHVGITARLGLRLPR